MSPLRRKMTLAVLSTALSAAVAVPLVLSAIEPNSGTVRIVDTSEDARALLEARRGASETAASDEEFAGDPRLAIEPLDAETAATFFPLLRKSTALFDEKRYYRSWPFADHIKEWEEHPNGQFRIKSNDLGMREDEDVRTDDPPLRVLVLGDSHTFGICDNHESFANLLEADLQRTRPARSVDVLNAGVGGYNPYNYLGTLESFVELAPDIVVVAIYCGNDYGSTAIMQRYFERRGAGNPPKAPAPGRKRDWVRSHGVRAQEGDQLSLFMTNPEDEVVAADTVNAILMRMARRCDRIGAELVTVLLPAPLSTQTRFYPEAREWLEGVLEVTDDDIAASDRISDRLVAFHADRGLECVDLRPAFRAATEPYYWFADLHLSVRGHRAAADAIFPVVDRLAGETEAPADVDSEQAPDPEFQPVALPVEDASGWDVDAARTDVLPIDSGSALMVRGGDEVTSLRIPVDPAGITRVRLGLVCDSAFSVRVAGGEWRAVGPTLRQVRPVELPVTATGDRAGIRIEFDCRETPLLVRSVGVR